MKQKQLTFFNKLIEDLIHNLIYYIPSDIIFNEVLEQFKGEIDDGFLDELSLLNIDQGIASFENEDALEVNSILLDKKSTLEQNLSKISKTKKKITPNEFEIFCEKYYDQLLFFISITEWLNYNLKKYNGDTIHLSIIGAFKLQHDYFTVHLKDFHRYFESYVNLEIEHDTTIEKLVSQYLPDLITRYNQSSKSHDSTKKKKKENEKKETDSDKLEGEVKNQPLEKETSTKKKERPEIVDKEIENMVLDAIFKIKVS